MPVSSPRFQQVIYPNNKRNKHNQEISLWCRGEIGSVLRLSNESGHRADSPHGREEPTYRSAEKGIDRYREELSPEKRAKPYKSYICGIPSHDMPAT